MSSSKTFFIALICIGLFLLFCIPKRVQASIHQADCFQALKGDLDALDSSCLVVLDVDEVLLTDQDAILSPVGDSLKFQIYNDYFSHAKTKKEKQNITDILSLTLILSPKKLVEKNWVEAIEQLQKQKVLVIALTSCPIHEGFGVLKDVERWRVDQLKNEGIDFSSSFPNLSRHQIKSLVAKGRHSPIYNQGILFTGSYSKAEVLKSFLKELSLRPKKVLFVDNLLSNVQQMEICLIQENIPHVGIQYQYVEKRGCLKLNPELARKQYEHLFKHQEWLHDEEAAKKYKLKN